MENSYPEEPTTGIEAALAKLRASPSFREASVEERLPEGVTEITFYGEPKESD